MNHVTFVIEDNDDETDIVINDFNYVTFAYDDKLMKKRKIAMNVGKYLVSEETEETPEKTTCKGNQPWIARFVEKILNNGENKDTPQKSTCTGHFGIAKFVETKTIISSCTKQYFY